MYFIIGFCVGVALGVSLYYYQKKRKQELHTTLTKLKQEKQILDIQKEEIKKSISELETYASKAGDVFYKQKMEIAQVNFEKDIEKLASEFRIAKENLTNEYLEAIHEESNRFADLLRSNKEELSKCQIELEHYQQAVVSAAELAKREQEMAEKENFYKIQITDLDRQEIEKLRSIIPYLRNPDPVNKIIWSSYYMRPLNDLIGRVMGSTKKTGIYKLTDRNTGLVYIGQAVNVADRWKEHVRKGVGAEPATRNRLYPAMQQSGPENFTFEVVEECESARLNEREKYWISYFDSCSSGLNLTTGGAKK